MIRYLAITGVTLAFLLGGCWAAWALLQEDIPWSDENDLEGWERHSAEGLGAERLKSHHSAPGERFSHRSRRP